MTNQIKSLTKLLKDNQGQDLILLKPSNGLCKYMLIACGTSSTHVKSIAEKLIHWAKQHNHTSPTTEGLQQGLWVVVDVGETLVHVFQSDVRDYYQLDSLWDKAPLP